MPKGSDPDRPRARRPRASRTSSAKDGEPEADTAATGHERPAPSLGWAKWIETLGADQVQQEPLEPGADLAQVAERLRVATTAAHQARAEREAKPPAPTLTATAPAARGGATRADTARRTKAKPAKKPAPPRSAARRAAASPPAPALAPLPLPAPAPAPHAAADFPFADDPLPTGYGEDRITLICKDPYWLHAYWELMPASLERAWEMLGHTTAFPALRVHHFAAGATSSPAGSFDIEVNDHARNWYIHGGRPGASFEAEIGLKSVDGRFVGLARSQRVSAPADRPSDLMDEEWLSAAGEFEEIYALSGGYRTLTGGGSLELRELLARRLEEMMGSGAVSSFGIPSLGISSFGASGAYMAARREERRFWFVLGTELIVYGATEPDATVTCQGRPVSLRPDGTFTLRFALPDGVQVIPCAATSADRIDTITITPRVEKATSQEDRTGADEESP